MIELQTSNTENLPWTDYVILKNGEKVGQCAFKTIPINGKVEIAYWVYEAFENQGIGSEACRLLTELSLQKDPSVAIIARTLMQESASTSILKKNLYQFRGVVSDPEDGEVWEWEYDKIYYQTFD